MRIAVFAVPYDAGRLSVGVGLGPARLLDAGLAHQLREAGHDVREQTIVGARDLDPAEGRALASSPVKRLTPEDAATSIGPMLGGMSQPAPSVYVHLDLDVLEPAHARANQYNAPGGFSPVALTKTLSEISEVARLYALGITAYDPAYDPDGRTCRAAIDALNAIVPRPDPAEWCPHRAFAGRGGGAMIRRMLGNRPMGEWIEQYSLSHQHPINRILHTLGIPMIAVSILLALAGVAVPVLLPVAAVLFVLGWVLQFVGHAYEGKPPEFFKDWRFLFVGLRWWFAKMSGRA